MDARLQQADVNITLASETWKFLALELFVEDVFESRGGLG
jgi:hypothetical protein